MEEIRGNNSDQDHEETVLYTESAKPAKLTIRFEGETKREYMLLKKTTIIGQSELCDIYIDEPAASEHHAKIMTIGPTYFITDLSSHNGTRVNGQFISHHPLTDKDSIQIGRTFITFSIIKHKDEIVEENTDAVEEATTISSQVSKVPYNKQRTKQKIKAKVEVIRKSKGIKRFFSTPLRTLGTSIFIGFIFLIFLIMINPHNKKHSSNNSPKHTDLSTSSSNSSNNSEQPDITERMQQYKKKKKIEQLYFNAIADFNMVIPDVKDKLRYPTNTKLEQCLNKLNALKDKFIAIQEINENFKDTTKYLEQISNISASVKTRELSMISNKKTRINRLRQIGKKFFDNREFSSAELTYKELLNLVPHDETALKYLKLIKNKRNAKIATSRKRKQIKKYLRLMQQNLSLGQAAYEQGKYASALKAWQKVEDEFTKIEAFSRLKTGSEYKKGLILLNKCKAYKMAVKPKLDKMHEKARSILGRGVTYESIGKTEKAVAEWRKIFDIISDPADEYFKKAKEKIRKYE